MAAVTKVWSCPIQFIRCGNHGSEPVSRLNKSESSAPGPMYRSRLALIADEAMRFAGLAWDRRTKSDPRVFISLGSIILWAGDRPRLFKRLIRRGELRPNLRTLSALV